MYTTQKIKKLILLSIFVWSKQSKEIQDSYFDLNLFLIKF